MPVEETPDGKKLVLKHPKGASAEILFFGATIISWKSVSNGDPTEHLFVSSKAYLDGSKAVRGGIPIVFPFFGAPTRPEHSKLPQHGFARSETWSWDGSTVIDTEAAVSVRLTLTPNPNLTQDPVQLSYVVTLAEHQLSTDIHVMNTSTSTVFPPQSIEFQALLHTYIRAPAKDVHVNGLKGLYYTDKTRPEFPRKEEERSVVDVQTFTDSVYEDGPREYEVTWSGGCIKVKAIGLRDLVVWNPNREAGSKLADMEKGGWEKFICVEPGFVSGWAKVAPGQTWIGGQTLTVVHESRRI